jgi:hypothetical protein
VNGEFLITCGIAQVDGTPIPGRVIPRMMLDAWLVDAATRAGARLLEEHTVVRYETTPRSVTGIGTSTPRATHRRRRRQRFRHRTNPARRVDNVAGDERRCDLHFSSEVGARDGGVSRSDAALGAGVCS